MIVLERDGRLSRVATPEPLRWLICWRVLLRHLLRASSRV